VTSLSDILEKVIHRLTAAGCDTPRLDAEVLLAHSLGRDRTWLYLHFSDPLDEKQINKIEALLRRRERREPVAYIVGHKEFFGLDFEVTSAVLIPRPETELLVETAVQWSIINCQLSIVNGKFTIIDVGTGSGCIVVVLAKHLPDAAIFAVDTSPETLLLARRNAERNEVSSRITFLQGDLLGPLPEPVDLIVSNPPYVSRAEVAAAMPEVSRYEPRLALDGGEDGLEVIRRLLPQAREKLKPGGSLLIEIGASQGQAVRQLAQFHFPGAAVAVKKDLAGLDRLLVVKT
jgi:release factor glutamine methyltransferase